MPQRVCDVLLICVTNIERESIIAEARCNPTPELCNETVFYNLSARSHKYSIYLVQCQMGSGTSGGSHEAVTNAIRDLGPRQIIMLGIAFGMDSSNQAIGQVLVAEYCVAYDPERVGQDGKGRPKRVSRGSKIPAHPRIIMALKAAARDITPPPIFGVLLSGAKLIDNENFKRELLIKEVEAIGGDMELNGLVTAAVRAGIPWAAAKAICDFADGNKNINKPENQNMAATNSARLIFKTIRGGLLGPGDGDFSSIFEAAIYNGDPPDERIRQLGFVDIGLKRTDLSWRYLANSLDDLIDNIPERGEYFIVARSLEAWMKSPRGQTQTYLEKLARTVVPKQLRVTFVLPDKNLKSLVLSDPSQGVQDDLWQTIETVLHDAIKEEYDRQSFSDLEHGVLEIYTIPAYVPSTFSMISTYDNVEYCSLEVGIGIPLGQDDRVLLYFEKNQNNRNIFDRLCTIYRGIINERQPKYKFPATKRKPPEYPHVLSKLYNEMLDAFQTKGFYLNHRHKNRDWFHITNDNQETIPEYKLNKGAAASIATLPFAQYIGGQDVLRIIKGLKKDLSAFIKILCPSDQSMIKWVKDKELLLTVFQYKSSFTDPFTTSLDDNSGKKIDLDDPEIEIEKDLDDSEIEELIETLSKHKPFRIKFKEFMIDTYGRVMLLGYPEQASQEELSKIRSALLDLSKIQYRHFNARRTQEIVCVFGLLTNELSARLLQELKVFTQEHFKLQDQPVLEVDRLRLVRMEGNFAAHSIESIGTPIAMQTKLLEDPSFDTYGIAARGKWLAHKPVVDNVKQCTFDKITPVTVHFSPSLKCDYKCPTCSYGQSKKQLTSGTVSKMRLDEMKATINKLVNFSVKGIIFTGGGEPLTNKDTVKAIRYAKSSGMSVGLFTNGFRLDSRASHTLLSGSLWPDFIRFSINAGTPDSYRLVHGCNPDCFNTVLKNLEDACVAKWDCKAGTRIDIGVLLSPAIRDNLMDLAIEIKHIALRHPGTLNNVLFRPAIYYNGGNRRNDYSKELVADSSYGDSYKSFFNSGKQFDASIINELKQLVLNRVRPLLMDGSDCELNVFYPEIRTEMASRPVSDRVFNKCLACNLVVFVAPDTSVYRCVEQALDRDNNLSLGRLKDVNSLEDLWVQDNLSKWSPNLECCPPVCLLYETNVVWDQICKKYQAETNSEELAHQLEIAKEYFERKSNTGLGSAINFI